MAEGLDSAADAFRAAISPGSVNSLPRDESGRFASTGPRPEPLFQDRPLEGDPLSGDVRDGGEDPRLAAMERRVADGREEDSDRRDLEKSVQDDAARRRDAAARRGRDAPEDAEQERRELQPGETAEDAARRHANEEAEREPGERDGEPERDAEGEREAGEEREADARWALTLDGKPVEKVEVDVAGEKREVTLSEVMRGYADNQALQTRERGFAERAQQWEGSAAQANQAIAAMRDEYMKRLDYAGRLIQDLTPKEPDWNAEYRIDPKAAHEKEEVYRHVRGRMQAIANEMLEEQQAQAMSQGQSRQMNAEQTSAYIQWGKEEFAKRKGISTPAALANEFQAMRRVALEVYGFNEHEVGTVFDPRMLDVLHDASKWRRATANLPRPVRPDTGRTLAPGGSRPLHGGGGARRGIDDALRNQTKAGGSIDATAAVFERLLR